MGEGKDTEATAEAQTALASVLARMDGWQNLVTSLGAEGKDHTLASRFVRRKNGRGGLDRAEIETMYEEDPIFARIIDAVPDNATRRWIRVQGTMDEDGTTDDDFGRAVLDALEELDAQSQFFELMRLDRLDGGAAMILGADDGQSPDKPLNLEAVQRVSHLNVVSRYEIIPGELTKDPMDPNFRKPESYRFTGQVETGQEQKDVHHSRIIRLTGIRTTERQQTARDGWGLPLAERLYETIRQYGTAYRYTEAMLKDITQGVMQIKGLSDLIAGDAEAMGILIKRLTALHLGASAFNAILLDEGETYERRGLQSGGTSEVLVRFMDKLAAVAEMPLSILFGQPPTGLSTDDKAGRATFYDSIATKQRRLLMKPINRVIDALLHAQEGPTDGQVPAQWSFDFLPLNEPSDKEEADTALVKAQTDQILIGNGVITESEARSRHANDPTSPYQLDLETDEAAAELATPDPDLEAEAEGLDLRDPDTEDDVTAKQG